MIMTNLQSQTCLHKRYSLVTLITSDLIKTRDIKHSISHFIQVCVICIVVSVAVCVFSTHAMTGLDC